MTISSEEVYLLNNRMGRVANKVQLGTLIQNAESVTAGEIGLADGKILVGNASNVGAAQTVSGDITISNAGVAAIAAGVIVNADINAGAAIAYSKLSLANSIVADDLTAGSVTLAKLHSGVAPSHVVKFAGEFTTLAGSANQTISVPGMLGTDLVFLMNKDSDQSVLTAAAAADQINVVMSADPGAGDILTYQVLRAAV